MAEFKISRFRYTWKGDWVTATPYIKDDVIKYGGSTWVCIRQHTSSLFNSDLTFVAEGDTDPSPAWIKMTDGYSFRGNWQPTTLYNPGDIVTVGGSVVLNLISHTSSATFNLDRNNWTDYSLNYKWLGSWQPATVYYENHVIKYGATIYACIEDHTSNDASNGLEIDQDKWQIIYRNIEFRGDYDTGIKYRLNDLVQFGGSIWRCVIAHTSGSDSTVNFNEDQWQLSIPGQKYQGEWSVSVSYTAGDIVRNGGYLYLSLKANYGLQPDGSPLDWLLLTKNINFRGSFDVAETYYPGDVITIGGNTYVAITEANPTDDPNLEVITSEQKEQVWDETKFSILSYGFSFKGSWSETVRYHKNDIVFYFGNSYRCVVNNTATSQNFPLNGSGLDYWEIYSFVNEDNGLTARGDLLQYNIQPDGSSFGLTNIAIGATDQLLSINNLNNYEYTSWGQNNKLVYVSTSGIDDDDEARGIDPFKPFRTIRSALEFIESINDGSSTYKIFVSTGVYEEVLPLVVPRGCTIQGTELRSTTVKAASADSELANDPEYRILAIQRIRDIILNVLSGSTIQPSDGNEISQNIAISTDASIGQEAELILDHLISYINFNTRSIGDQTPTVTGSNEVNIGPQYDLARENLLSNKEFLAQEAVSFLAENYPSYNFNTQKYLRDFRRYIDAIIYDLFYTGNYKIIREGVYYKNQFIGSATENMFLVRDTTGIRDMTLDGLIGTLNPANVFELYQRPTGGAYVSLDPGWGPNDESVWIVNRSCYVQNVTTFGFASIGQKIDGSLHNGGNKSIVSNDFTQVISDGIGAYVLNNGRAELVSVFTYYSQIGYFAENGGVIRATNGNNSYGKFGALATGNDPAETPKFANVTNRLNQAQVVSAFAGEVNDEILIFEFLNAGEQYTTASYSITGSGVNAEVIQDEIRDNALFDVKIINGPSGQSAGGSGFSQIGNNAQTGDQLTITIATNDTNEEANLLGLRIILTSGPGTGQYGYVHAYNSTTKVVTVYKESTGLPGWDHVIPGYPIASSLQTQTVYRFEPRPMFSSPEFSVSSATLSSSTSWANAVFGETYETYSNVIGSAGTGVVIEDDGLSPITARWDVIKNGTSYQVSLSNAGAGYELNQEVIILGSSVGGNDVEHDISVIVTEISDDSTNSIVGFSYDGIGQSGRFIITPSNSVSVPYSTDTENWTTGTLPTAGNWKALAYGNQTFVTLRKGSDQAARSKDGKTWSSIVLPAIADWESVAFGKNIFVAIASDGDKGSYSKNDGLTWSSFTLPDIGDSTFNRWIDIAYGAGKFVAIADTGNHFVTIEYDSVSDSFEYVSGIMDVISDSSQRDWISITYGNNRFVAISQTGDIAYSFNGLSWYGGDLPTQDGSTIMNWKQIKYGQGTFFAVCDTGGKNIAAEPTTGPTQFIVTSSDGVNWNPRTLATSLSWGVLAFGRPDLSTGDSTFSNRTPRWIVAPSTNSSTINVIQTGTKALGRVVVESGRITQVKIWEPGSGYSTSPDLTIIDPNNTTELFVNNRLGDGVLAQPSWINRGTGYRTSSTVVEITGDGFADIIPVDKFVSLENLEIVPGPGAQFRFGGQSNLYTVVQVLNSFVENGNLVATFRITPTLTIDEYLEHNTQVQINERYSQIRITGHDFLDIGTGNFEQTNYPSLYSGGFFSSPENEVFESEGGRVFYTSTDQSGNFRTGELFAVEQATGIVTISADFFDLEGLTELALGGVRLGGSGTVIREFSTDTLFTADSNNVVPTQRAIAAYLQNRLNVGGSDLLTASFIAGQVRVGPNLITSTSGLGIVIPVMADFSGNDTAISGSMLANNFYYKSFKDV